LISDQDKTSLSALASHVYTQDKPGELSTVQQVPPEKAASAAWLISRPFRFQYRVTAEPLKRPQV